jgi:molecular chaperone Hsp33
MTEPLSRDVLTRFVFERAAVRGALVNLSATSRAILACHPYPRALERVMAELLAACALLSSTLRFSGSLVMQLQGDGPVRLLVVECTDTLALRATAQWDGARTTAVGPDATLADLAGGATRGRLVITLDPRGAGTIYQGIVTLETASVAGLIEHYLATSEQLVSRMALVTHDGIAAGLLMQRMPGAAGVDDDTWERACGRMLRFDPATLLATDAPQVLLAAAFPHDDLRVFKGKDVVFRCACSRERVENALRIAGREEIESVLRERGDVEVTCEFCNHAYLIGAAEARALFPPAPGALRH